MIKSIIDGSLKNGMLVFMATAFLILAGAWSVKNIKLDAIPDLSDVQVILFTKFPGQAPQVVEDQVTYPLTTTMLQVPGAKLVRGYSFFNYSFVYIIFEEGTDMYWARSRVLEYANTAAQSLPAGVKPVLGPDATGVGWIYEYVLVDKTGKHDLAELRSLQDWVLRYRLETVKNVSEVASVGGFVKQYQVEVDPNILLAYNIPLSKVKHAIMRSNNDVGGRLVEMAETEFLVRGLGYIKSVDDLNQIPVGVDKNGTPIRLMDVAHVHLGPELRRGAVDYNGEGETAGGIVVMRFGENALTTIEAIREKIAELQKIMPEGVEIVPMYDRGALIERSVDNLKEKLFEEFIVIALVCMIFLLHARSALVAIITLPMGMLMAFILMQWQGLSANIMSLGGIAITLGAMVDGAIVLIENAHKHLEHGEKKKGSELTIPERWTAIRNASQEVAPALFFSLLIITSSYLVIFTLEEQSGRLFKPLAFTATYIMAAAAVLAVTLVPLLMGYFIRGKIIPEEKNPVNRFLKFLHGPSLAKALKYKGVTLTIALAVLLSVIYPLGKLGSEFMPPLDEGDILYMPTAIPGISITKSKEMMQQMDKILMTFPEVQSVFGKNGRAETSTDPASLAMTEITIRVKPRDQWPDPSKTTAELKLEMDKAIQFPAVANAWGFPIKTRIDMLSTGIKTPVGVKIIGPDLLVLQRLGKQIEGVLKMLPDTKSAMGDRAMGGYYLDFDIDRKKAARYGLTTGDVQDVIQSAIGGMDITETVEGLERYPVNLRYARGLRSTPEELKRMLISTPTGVQIPIAQVANLVIRRGPPSIKSENSLSDTWIYVDIKTSDIGGYVEKAKQAVEAKVKIPPGYEVLWSGQYEYMQQANERMQLAAPLVLVLIFLLLYFNFKTLVEPMVVMASVPFALAGGVWLIYLMDYNLSVAVDVGFIALAGVAAEIGVLVLTFIGQEVARKREELKRSLTSKEIFEAVLNGTSQRVRAIAMTAAAIIAGLLPIMWSSGTGSSVMQRIAAPMVGGMLTTLIVCLIVMPVFYCIILQSKEKRAMRRAEKA
ncbi:MAG: CusA/CzcA family heavy metal efflux RND transporter [Mariprofundaceae bacterium]|nr:CusA/CzcA family heavy metal efflux RND transporter [Mariprofundaceae bacterium]